MLNDLGKPEEALRHWERALRYPEKLARNGHRLASSRVSALLALEVQSRQAWPTSLARIIHLMRNS